MKKFINALISIIIVFIMLAINFCNPEKLANLIVAKSGLDILSVSSIARFFSSLQKFFSIIGTGVLILLGAYVLLSIFTMIINN